MTDNHTVPTVDAARNALVTAVLALLHTERGDSTDAHWSDQVDYDTEHLDLAARDLTRALEGTPDEQPVGWNPPEAARRRAMALLVQQEQA